MKWRDELCREKKAVLEELLERHHKLRLVGALRFVVCFLCCLRLLFGLLGFAFCSVLRVIV